MYEMPPLGLKPQGFWVEDRLREILAAIERYEDAGWPVPSDWITEHNEHVMFLEGRS